MACSTCSRGRFDGEARGGGEVSKVGEGREVMELLDGRLSCPSTSFFSRNGAAFQLAGVGYTSSQQSSLSASVNVDLSIDGGSA